MSMSSVRFVRRLHGRRCLFAIFDRYMVSLRDGNIVRRPVMMLYSGTDSAIAKIIGNQKNR